MAVIETVRKSLNLTLDNIDFRFSFNFYSNT